MDDESASYEVGYGRPPKQMQFQKGVSGNPKGRPKGSQNLTTIFNRLASAPVTITEGNRSRVVPLKEAVMTQLVNGAARGDRYARREFLQFAALAEAQEEAAGSDSVPHERDEAGMRALMQRLVMSQASLLQTEGFEAVEVPSQPEDDNVQEHEEGE